MDVLEKGKIPIFRLLIPYLFGIWLAIDYSWVGHFWFLYTLSFSSLTAFILLNVSYKKFKIYRYRWLGGLFIYLSLFSLGIIQTEQYKEPNQATHFSHFRADQLVVCVNSEPKLSGDILRFTASVRANLLKKQPTITNGTLLIALKVDTQNTDLLKYGDLMLIKSNYQPTEPPFNTAEFNFKKYLQHQNVYYQTFINQYAFIRQGEGNALIAYAITLRKKLVDRFKHYMTDQDAVSVASTLILGYRADLSKEILQAYSKTGTTHVLSVSGMHVAVIYGIINVLLKFLNPRRHGRMVKVILSIILIWFYALLTGFSPAVCRAAVMITFVIMGKAYRKKISMLNVLSISAFLLLLYNPLYLADVGFQLSYLAVFGLIYLQPIIYELIHFRNRWSEKIWSICSISLAAQLITFPLCMFYFHQFPIYFLISNIFIILPSTVIMASGIAFLLSSSISALEWLSHFTSWVLEKTITLMNGTLQVIENLPFSSWNKIWITEWENIILYLSILAIVGYIQSSDKLIYKRLLILSLILLSINISWKNHRSLRNNGIHLFSLRKNSAFAFQTKQSMIVLSDLKPTDKTYQFSIQPYIDSSKVSKLTLLNFQQDIIGPNFRKKGNLIQFQEQTMLLLDPANALRKLNTPIKIDFLLVRGNPRITVKKLLENYAFDVLVIDGSNSDFLIKKLQTEADTLDVKNLTLKRNFSVNLHSN